MSRRLEFSLKRLSSSLIAERMKVIATADQLDLEPAALAHLARAADGSMRDGLSLLDQLIAFGGGALSEANTRAMLGTIDRGHMPSIVERCRVRTAPACSRNCRVGPRCTGLYRALADLAAFLQRVAIVQIVPDAAQEDEEFDADVLARMSRSMSAADVQLTTRSRSPAAATCRSPPTAAGLRDDAAAHAGVPARRAGRRDDGGGRDPGGAGRAPPTPPVDGRAAGDGHRHRAGAAERRRAPRRA